MSQQCETESLTPTWVSIGFSIGSFLMLLITLIYSLKHLKSSHTDKASDWDNASGCFAKVKLCAKDVWSRKGVYLPLIAHLSDTATDFASIAEFVIVALNTDPKQCGVNVWYFVFLGIGCMSLYRIVSSYKVYEITGSCCRACLQILDLELYRILYVSHVYGITSKSSPHRLLSVLEAVFEAAPQSVIQLLFLMFTGIKSPVIIASTIFSFFNLTLSIIGDDTKFLGIEFSKKPCCETTEEETVRCKTLEFVLLYIYRFMDIPTKMLFFVFLWYFIWGWVCSAVVFINIVLSIHTYYRTENTDALFIIIAVPFSLQHGDDDGVDSVRRCWCYAMIEAVTVNVVIWLFAVFGSNIDAALSPLTVFTGSSYADLSSLTVFDAVPTFITVLWWYCSVCSIGKWLILALLVRVYRGCSGFCCCCSCLYSLEDCYSLEDALEAFSGDKERADVEGLVEGEKWTEAMEVILYTYPISVAATKLYACPLDPDAMEATVPKTLMDIAVECDNETILNAVRSVYNEKDMEKLIEEYWNNNKGQDEEYDDNVVEDQQEEYDNDDDQEKQYDDLQEQDDNDDDQEQQCDDDHEEEYEDDQEEQYINLC